VTRPHPARSGQNRSFAAILLRLARGRALTSCPADDIQVLPRGYQAALSEFFTLSPRQIFHKLDFVHRVSPQFEQISFLSLSCNLLKVVGIEKRSQLYAKGIGPVGKFYTRRDVIQSHKFLSYCVTTLFLFWHGSC